MKKTMGINKLRPKDRLKFYRSLSDDDKALFNTNEERFMCKHRMAIFNKEIKRLRLSLKWYKDKSKEQKEYIKELEVDNLKKAVKINELRGL